MFVFWRFVLLVAICSLQQQPVHTLHPSTAAHNAQWLQRSEGVLGVLSSAGSAMKHHDFIDAAMSELPEAISTMPQAVREEATNLLSEIQSTDSLAALYAGVVFNDNPSESISLQDCTIDRGISISGGLFPSSASSIYQESLACKLS